MAESEGTAGIDEDSLKGNDVLEGAEEREEDADGDEQVVEEVAEPPRRRTVSELLEGQDALEEGDRSDLQLVAPPLHVEVGDAGQAIYQLDLSGGEPEGTLLVPESSGVAHELDHAAGAGTGDAHAVLKQMIADRDRQVMSAERDGVSAYELAAGIDDFVATLIETVRRSDS